MSDPIRIRSRSRDGLTEMLVLLPHPMESGLRRNEVGGVVPAHFITTVHVAVAGRTVLDARLSMAVSQDPLLSFRCRGVAAGDPIVVTWTDNLGDSRSDRGVVS